MNQSENPTLTQDYEKLRELLPPDSVLDLYVKHTAMMRPNIEPIFVYAAMVTLLINELAIRGFHYGDNGARMQIATVMMGASSTGKSQSKTIAERAYLSWLPESIREEREGHLFNLRGSQVGILQGLEECQDEHPDGQLRCLLWHDELSAILGNKANAWRLDTETFHDLHDGNKIDEKRSRSAQSNPVVINEGHLISMLFCSNAEMMARLYDEKYSGGGTFGRLFWIIGEWSNNDSVLRGALHQELESCKESKAVAKRLKLLGIQLMGQLERWEANGQTELTRTPDAKRLMALVQRGFVNGKPLSTPETTAINRGVFKAWAVAALYAVIRGSTEVDVPDVEKAAYLFKRSLKSAVAADQSMSALKDPSYAQREDTAIDRQVRRLLHMLEAGKQNVADLYSLPNFPQQQKTLANLVQVASERSDQLHIFRVKLTEGRGRPKKFIGTDAHLKELREEGFRPVVERTYYDGELVNIET